MNALIKLIKDCLTENDCQTYCPFRVAAMAFSASGIPTFLGNTLYATYKTGHFDAVAFGIGFGGMMTGLTALAVGVAVKAKTDTGVR